MTPNHDEQHMYMEELELYLNADGPPVERFRNFWTLRVSGSDWVAFVAVSFKETKIYAAVDGRNLKKWGPGLANMGATGYLESWEIDPAQIAVWVKQVGETK